MKRKGSSLILQLKTTCVMGPNIIWIAFQCVTASFSKHGPLSVKLSGGAGTYLSWQVRCISADCNCPCCSSVLREPTSDVATVGGWQIWTPMRWDKYNEHVSRRGYHSIKHPKAKNSLHMYVVVPLTHMWMLAFEQVELGSWVAFVSCRNPVS